MFPALTHKTASLLDSLQWNKTTLPAFQLTAMGISQTSLYTFSRSLRLWFQNCSTGQLSNSGKFCAVGGLSTSKELDSSNNQLNSTMEAYFSSSGQNKRARVFCGYRVQRDMVSSANGTVRSAKKKLFAKYNHRKKKSSTQLHPFSDHNQLS